MKIAKKYDDGKLIVYLYGELDHHCARPAMKAITELIDQFLPRETVLDLSGLTFMDSSGIALLLKTNRLAKAHLGVLWVEHPSRQVLRVLEASGITRIVPVAQESNPKE